MPFELQAPYQPTGDQPEAIAKMVAGIQRGMRHQVLLGATGTGKTFTVANVIQQVQLPALCWRQQNPWRPAHAAEFKGSFPTRWSIRFLL